MSSADSDNRADIIYTATPAEPYTIYTAPRYRCVNHGEIDSVIIFDFDGGQDYVCARCWRHQLRITIGFVERITDADK